MSHTDFSIAVLGGDGIGPEVMVPCLDILTASLPADGTLSLTFQNIEAGAAHYQKTGISIAPGDMALARQADAILLGAMGLPSVRYDNGTEIAPQLELRETLGLYAGVRPIRTIPGLPPVLADARGQALDLVLIRESTEGLFAARGKTTLVGDEAAHDTMVITRNVSEKLFDFSFALGAQRRAAGKPGHVTCVDKANVLGSLAFFRKIFDERAARFGVADARHAYVDAVALTLVKQPWIFDVLVTENMFGDILSDIGAALMGGMGFAPSADIGDDNAVFQPCHGSAPDIAGEGKANPVAMILSGAMMLEWLSFKHDCLSARVAAETIRSAVDAAFNDPRLLPYEIGGSAGTQPIAEAVLREIRAANP